jgi:hypothetical protein
MRKLFVLAAILMTFMAQAEEEFLGIYMSGNKIGYSSYNTHPDTLGSEKVIRTDSKTVLDAALLGAAMKMRMEGSTWANSAGKPLKMHFTMTSAGRTQKIVALFNAKTAEIDVSNGGQDTHRSLPIPGDGVIVDDPLELVVAGKTPTGGKKTIYVLDPTTVSFMKTDVVVVGPGSTTVKGKKISATHIQIIDPRITMDVYVSTKGDLIKAEAIGMEMIPESRAVALNGTGKTAYKPSSDLAFATSLKTDKKISDPAALTGLTLRLTGKDLSRLPSDEHQSVKRAGDGWVIDVHPPKLSQPNSAVIAEVGKQKPEWLKPTLNIPSGSETFRQLASRLLKEETKVIPAAIAVKNYVHSIMRPNAGIGVLRDATEVLASKEGVCRDYAILTATLMRASGIPARLASGVVNWQGDFFYHAWVEIWDGTKWVGIDSTVPEQQMSASHVKLADGNVEDAFAFTFLDKVKIEVLDIRRK